MIGNKTTKKEGVFWVPKIPFSRKGIIWDETTWWIIALVVFALVAVFILLISKQGQAIMDKLKEFLMFGR